MNRQHIKDDRETARDRLQKALEYIERIRWLIDNALSNICMDRTFYPGEQDENKYLRKEEKWKQK